jgi:hypothetical protein
VNNLLVPVKNVDAAIHNIHAPLCVMTHGKDTLKHLHDAGVSTGGRGGTITVGSVRRGHIQRRRGVATTWRLGNSRVKRLMCHILIELLMSHHLDHAHNIRSESTRSLRVYSNVPYLIDDVVKGIKVLILHNSIKKVPLIGRYGI